MTDDAQAEPDKAAAEAFITHYLGEEWLNKPPEEIVVALRETDWYKSRVKIIEDWDEEYWTCTECGAKYRGNNYPKMQKPRSEG